MGKSKIYKRISAQYGSIWAAAISVGGLWGFERGCLKEGGLLPQTKCQVKSFKGSKKTFFIKR